jgi:hypothetical protein
MDKVVLAERTVSVVKITCTNNDVVTVVCTNVDEAKQAMNKLMEQTKTDQLVNA